MKITLTTKRPTEVETEILVLGAYKDEGLTREARSVDERLGGLLSSAISIGDFKGDLDSEPLVIYTGGKLPAKRVMLVGLGEKKGFNRSALMEAAARAARKAKALKVGSYASTILGSDVLGEDEAAGVIAEATLLATYRFSKYLSKEEKGVEEVELLVENVTPELRESVKLHTVLAEATNFARDVSNTPSSDATPEHIERMARELAEKYGLGITVFEAEKLRELGMGGIYNVGRGSAVPPRMIVLEYRGGEKPVIVVVGKTVTFDSGGISIKPWKGMDTMKHDKSGGAAVLGIMKAVAEMKLPVRLIGILPAVENMPSGSAYKPGDIVRHYNGKTSEILSTDAEGRLTLADALAYASKNYKPDVLLDLATLTGSCIVAIGNNASCLMSNDDRLAGLIEEAAELSWEKVWRFPLWKEYFELIKSKVADLSNIGKGRAAGGITAAAFLASFVEEGVPWAHLDIAGSAWIQEGTVKKPYLPDVGATGVGVGLVVNLIRLYLEKGV